MPTYDGGSIVAETEIVYSITEIMTFERFKIARPKYAKYQRRDQD